MCESYEGETVLMAVCGFEGGVAPLMVPLVRWLDRLGGVKIYGLCFGCTDPDCSPHPHVLFDADEGVRHKVARVIHAYIEARGEETVAPVPAEFRPQVRLHHDAALGLTCHKLAVKHEAALTAFTDYLTGLMAK